MKVNLWAINYAPELTGIGVYNTELCEYLSQQGDQVEVVTGFAYYPGWRKHEDDRGVIYRSQVINEVTIHRCWQFVSSRPSVFKRMVHEASFVLTSFMRQVVLPAPDVYIVVSPPLLLGFAARIMSRIKHRPYVFHVQDLQPDAALAMNMIESGPLMKILFWLESFAYDGAAVVSGISRQMCQAFAGKGVKESKIVLSPNWIRLPETGSMSSGEWHERYQLAPDVHIVSYSGNFGVKQELEIVLDAAKRLANSDGIFFVITGDGAQKESLLKLKAANQLSNVRFEDVLPAEQHARLIMESDICLITQKPGSGSVFLPSKLLKILAHKKPVVSNADEDSALKKAIDEGGFGLTVNGGAGDALARAIVDLVNDPQSRQSMGEKGLQYVRQFESRDILSEFRSRLMAISQGSCQCGEKK